MARMILESEPRAARKQPRGLPIRTIHPNVMKKAEVNGMKRILSMLLATVTALSLLSGCGSSASSSSGAPAASGDASQGAASSEPASGPQKGGVLKIGTNAELNYNMMCFSLTGASLDYVYSWPIYESLFKPNAQGTVDPWLLEKFEQDPEAKTYTFYIRKGIKFSDGSDFNAETCKWNLDHYLEVGAKRTALLGDIESVNIIDDYTVQLQLSKWNSTLPYAFSRECGYMFSKLQYETYGDEYCRENPVGTGPFVLKSWTRDVNKVFERNPNYWGGEVLLDGVEYTIYSDALVAQAALKSGEIDVYAGMSWEGAVDLDQAGFQIKTSAVKSHVALLCFNALNEGGNDPMGDLKVRQAVAYAIDKNALVEAVWHGYANVTNQFCVGDHYFNQGVKGYEYNVEKAKALLAEAGYPNGFNTVIKTQDSSMQRNAATIIQAFLKEVGINADVQILSGADGNKAETGWGEGMWFHTSSVYVSVPMQMGSMFRQGLTGGVLGLTTLLRPDDVNDALNRSIAAATEADAVRDIGEANRLLVDDYCNILPVAEYPYFYVVNSKVQDSGIGEAFYSVASLSTAWLGK